MTPQELKNSILQLAIQGKLVEQRAEEGTAEELFARIQQEKQRLIAEKKIKKEKPLPEITEDEKSFEIPESWKWVRLGDIFQHNTGKALNSTNRIGVSLKYITTSNLYWNRFELENLKEMFFTDAEVEKCTVKKGDLLVCEGGDFGRAAIWKSDDSIRIQNHIHRLRAYKAICTEFFYYLFYLYKHAGWIGGKGIGIQGLSSNAIHVLVFPLPPLAGQKRIVAKIEELLPYIDRYEQAWSKLEQFNSRFPDDMKKSLLQYAIQGKLVVQCPEEGTAEELFAQIQQEKHRLIAEKKIKKEKPLPEITDDEKPFDIPESWKWVRFGMVIDMLSGYAFKSQDFKQEGNYRLLRGINLGVDTIRWNDTVYLNEISDKLGAYKLTIGDVLLGLDRPWISEGIRVAIFDDLQDTFLVQRVLRIREIGAVTNKYAALILRSALFMNAVAPQTTGISVPHISPTQVGNVAIPLPPLAEQKRIVEKLEQLLPLCERLK